MSCGSLPLRVTTDADIADPAEWRVLSEFLDSIVTYIYTEGISLPSKVDLFVGLGQSREGTVDCVYYFSDHVHRSIFWLDAFDIRRLSVSGLITTEPSHLAHSMEAQYWSVHRHL